MKHTKGPWQGKDIEFFSRDIMGICATFNDDKTEAESNARLISCAPEMLDALINIVKNKQCDYVDEINIIERATGMKIEEVLK